MTEGGMDRPLSEDVMDVWGGYDDFESGGLAYIYWVQQQNLTEMAHASSESEVANELADQAIVAIRQLAEMGLDPEKWIRRRLDERMEGSQEDIIAMYQASFEFDQRRSVDTEAYHD